MYVDSFQSHLLRPHRLTETVFVFGYAMAIDATNEIIPSFFCLSVAGSKWKETHQKTESNDSYCANACINLTNDEFLIWTQSHE